MTLRVGDAYVEPTAEALSSALPEATARLMVFVHGLGTTEWSWALKSQIYYGAPDVTFATQFERDLGATCVFVRYNTGRHVSESGRALSALLAGLVEGYPVPLTSLTLVGHSMGGLVCRSACLVAERESARWAEAVTDVVYLGAPHRGAPLAKLGHVLSRGLLSIDIPATRVLGRLLDGRSAGVKDMRNGALVEEEWDVPASLLDRDSVPLPDARHTFVSGAVTKDPEDLAARLVGDMVVRVPSAAGPELVSQTFEMDTHHHGGVWHHELQNHPAVYARLLALLRGDGES
jgi:pimeloyl-ACP methyl ester carboxylesterase